MSKKKRKQIVKRNPEAKKLEDPLFRQRVVPLKKKPKDTGPSQEEWD